MHQFDEYMENLMSSIYNCSKGNDDLVNNSEFESLFYIKQFDNPSDASFCLLDINYDGRLSIDEIVNTTNMFAIHNINFQPISVHNYDSLSDTLLHLIWIRTLLLTNMSSLKVTTGRVWGS